MMATRASSRVRRDGIPIATKAANRIKALNDAARTSSKNPFTILNNTSNNALGKVIIDLDTEVVVINPGSLINLFPSKTSAQQINVANDAQLLGRPRYLTTG